MSIPTPSEAKQMVMFMPVGINPNDHDIASAPPAFDISTINGQFFVDSILISGECVESKEFSSFPDALEDCVRRMRAQSDVEYSLDEI